jgi:hypothetical protein
MFFLPQSSRSRIFRQRALQRLESAEQLDALVTFTPSRNRVFWVTMGLLLAGVIIWRLFG